MAIFRSALNRIYSIGDAISNGFHHIGRGISNISFGSPKPYCIEGPINSGRLICVAKQINKLVECQGKARLVKIAGDGLDVEDDTSYRQLKDSIGLNQSPELISRFVFEFFQKAYADISKVDEQDKKTLQITIKALNKQAITYKEKNYAMAIEFIHNLIFKEKINQYVSLLKDTQSTLSANTLPKEDYETYIRITQLILKNATWYAEWKKEFKINSDLECAQLGRDLIKFIDPEYREEDLPAQSEEFLEQKEIDEITAARKPLEATAHPKAE